jgi:hypothetical protein
MHNSGESPSNWAQATRVFFEQFLVREPVTFIWYPDGRHYIDDVAVSEAVFDFAYRKQLAQARRLWIAERGLTL